MEFFLSGFWMSMGSCSGGSGRWCCVRWWRWWGIWWGWWRWRWISTIPFGIFLLIFFVLWDSFSMWRFRTLSNHSCVPLFIKEFNHHSKSIEIFLEFFLFWRGTFRLSFFRHNGYGFSLRNWYCLYLFNPSWRKNLRSFKCSWNWKFGWWKLSPCGSPYFGHYLRSCNQ